MKFQDKCLFPLDGTRITFDDVFLTIQEKWMIDSRRTVDLSVKIKDFQMKLPIFWANMSTIMDDKTAKYLALMWWVGILHQNVTIEEQVKWVDKVKRFATPIIENPYCTTPDQTANEVIRIFEKHKIGAVVVVDSLERKKVLWIITKRDTNAKDSDDDLVNKLMTPIEKLKFVKSQNINNIMIDITSISLKKAKVEQIPILDNNGILQGLFTKKWLDYYQAFTNAARDKNNKLVVWAAIWQNRNPLERAKKLIEAGADVIVLDTAHAWRNSFLQILKDVKKEFPNIVLIAGNVDNPRAALDLAKAWANIIKVWIWPGWACKTRTQTGYGYPQLSAVWEVREWLDKNGFDDIMIIWDGGIDKSGNLAKVIAAGANFGMIGSLFAWTDITPGEIREINGKLYKDYRWMASNKEACIANRLSWRNEKENYGPIFDEWANDIIPYKGDGSFLKVLRKLHGWLASSLSYSNAKNLEDFYNKTRFGLQTRNGFMEWIPHAFK